MGLLILDLTAIERHSLGSALFSHILAKVNDVCDGNAGEEETCELDGAVAHGTQLKHSFGLAASAHESEEQAGHEAIATRVARERTVLPVPNHVGTVQILIQRALRHFSSLFIRESLLSKVIEWHHFIDLGFELANGVFSHFCISLYTKYLYIILTYYFYCPKKKQSKSCAFLIIYPFC